MPVAARLYCCCLLLALMLLGPGRAWGQAPPWEVAARSKHPARENDLNINDAAVDAAGNVFITGSFDCFITLGDIVLTTAGAAGDPRAMFVAKWDATARQFTWATSGGGDGWAEGVSIAVRGRNVYVTGHFEGTTFRAPIAGQRLASAGGRDVFVAKYLDTSTGHTAATSSYRNAWALRDGGSGSDAGNSIAVNEHGVFVTGYFEGAATPIAGQLLTTQGSTDLFVAKYLDLDPDSDAGGPGAAGGVASAWAVSGGGRGTDAGSSIAVQGAGVFVTGSFMADSGASIAGQALAGAGGRDVFVAKYVDTSTGHTPATSSYADAWATSAGGTGEDAGQSIAVSGRGVFVTGYFTSATAAVVAGQALAGAGETDMFVAKYVDTSTGHTPATSSYTNGWATSAGGSYYDFGRGVAVRGASVFVTGSFTTGTGFRLAGRPLPEGGTQDQDIFLAKYLDASTGHPTGSVASAWATSTGGPDLSFSWAIGLSGPTIYVAGTEELSRDADDNPTHQVDFFLRRLTDPVLARNHPTFTLVTSLNHEVATVREATPGTVLEVRDALGRRRIAATADAAGTARLALSGLAPGLYVVRGGGQAVRLVVEYRGLPSH